LGAKAPFFLSKRSWFRTQTAARFSHPIPLIPLYGVLPATLTSGRGESVMASRPSWKSFVRLSLVTIPVRGYTAHATTSDLPLHQVHQKCHNRIRYKKTCPVHGEVSREEIVSAYEVSKDEYVEIDPEELDKLRTEKEKAINIDAFIKADALDPAYFNGQTYYLLPDGPTGQKPYVLLRDGMAREDKHAVAIAVLRNREQLVLLRAMGELIAMELLHFAREVKKPEAFAEDVKEKEPTGKELELVNMLIKASTPKRFDFAKYEDPYKTKLQELIDAKVSGKKIVAPPSEEEPRVINLMDALKKSLQMQEEEAAPPRKMARSAGRRTRTRKAKARRAS
jgi:DNA end-binding protein Ku